MLLLLECVTSIIVKSMPTLGISVQSVCVLLHIIMKNFGNM